MMKTKNQKGVSLIIAFFVMIIILSAVLSVSIILYSGIKILRNISNSIGGFFAADSGVEKVLYYDRQIVPEGAKRGLCSIFDSNNSGACIADPYPHKPGEHSIYCNNPEIEGDGCDPGDCSECTIRFDTTLDSEIGIEYTTTAKISSQEGKEVFEIKSKGIYNSTGRQIQVEQTEKKEEE